MMVEVKLSKGRIGANVREEKKRGHVEEGPQGTHSRCSISLYGMLKQYKLKRKIARGNERDQSPLCIPTSLLPLVLLWLKRKKYPLNSTVGEERAYLAFSCRFISSVQFRNAKAETHAASHMTPIVKSREERKDLCGLLARLALS